MTSLKYMRTEIYKETRRNEIMNLGVPNAVILTYLNYKKQNPNITTKQIKHLIFKTK
jgi:hypothetical protein